MLVLLACAHGSLSEADLDRFRELHARVYEVYELPRDPDLVHELLAGSLAGEALTRGYLEHWTTLARMEDEATEVAIEDLAYERVEPLDERRLAADWRVTARVTHQGHQHLRVNRYQAVFELGFGGPAATDTRITGSWVRNAERLPGEVPTPGGEERLPLGELLERL